MSALIQLNTQCNCRRIITVVMFATRSSFIALRQDRHQRIDIDFFSAVDITVAYDQHNHLMRHLCLELTFGNLFRANNNSPSIPIRSSALYLILYFCQTLIYFFHKNVNFFHFCLNFEQQFIKTFH